MKAFWLATTLVLAAQQPGAAAEAALNPYESAVAPAPKSPLDKLVLGRLHALGLPPARVCSDAVFVRRVYLDVLGTLPTAREAAAFLRDPDPRKRARLIDRVLERPEFADYWALKWSDLLRVKAEFPINLWPEAAAAYHHWIRTQIEHNVPYDRFVRTLLTAHGSNFQVGPVNFYRAAQSREPQALAQVVALIFMGTRPSSWSADTWAGMAGFFSQVGYKPTLEWKEEIVYWDPGKATNGLAAGARFPDGTAARVSGERDPREVFADWLIDPRNPWFTQNIANRVWAWLLGRGVVQEPDDLRPDNPPSNPGLLACLERELIGAHYDLKHLYRLILNSQTYQLSPIPQTFKAEGPAQFAFYPLRRLEAEVLIDALDQITGTTENYSSAIPEPFTVVPASVRSIALPDGSITSSFLELFGRPPRDTGLESERNNRPSPDQRLHLLNSSHIQRKLDQSPKLRYLERTSPSFRQVATGLYLMILSRFPTAEELRVAQAYADAPEATRRAATVDLAWTLINSAEFLYRH